MRITFDAIPEMVIPHLNGGDGEVAARMFRDPNVKIMISRLPAGASIGTHLHRTSSEINYVLSGSGEAVCDDEREALSPGVCHYCPKGASHSIRNTGTDELALLTVVPEQ